MNNKRRKWLSITLLCAITAITLCFGAVFAFGGLTKSVKADNAVVDTVEIADYYFSGDSFTVPATAQINDGGKIYNGKFAGFIAPSGDVTENENIIFDVTGEYKAVYDYRKAGKLLSAQKAFKVVKRNWEVGSKDSSVEYGTVRTNEKGKNSTGLIVNLAAGDTFYYNEPVDLKSDEIHEIITMFSTAVKKKNNQILSTDENPLDTNLEAGIIEVKLTDCYNRKNFVTLKIEIRKAKGEGVYARTAATSQGEFGLYYDCPPKFGKPNVYIDGNRYGVYNGDYGQSVTTASYYNYMKWGINAQNGNVTFYHPQGDGEQSYLINQLYNRNISKSVFPGFTTGEVFVSLTATENYTSSTTFEIEQIGGKRGEDLISGGYFDKTAPVIKVDDKGVKGDVYIKLGEEFTIFNATAYDVNLSGDVRADVYYNYNTTAQSSVAVKNGKFVPLKTGRYVVEYNAKDSFGNIGRYALGVYALETDPITLTVDKVGDFVAGEAVTLPEHKITGLNGDASLKIKAIFNGTVTEINEETRTFIPLSVGEYEIVYEYADMFKTYSYSYKVKSLKNDECSFGELPVFNRYYIKGMAYSLPEVSAYKYEGETPTKVSYKTLVSFDGGNYAETDRAKTFISGSKTVKFKYVAENAVYESESFEIIDAGFGSLLDMSKYFKGDYLASASYSDIEFTSRKSSGDNALEFINPLSLKNFVFEYSMDGATAAKNGYSVVLKSRENYNHKVSVDFSYRRNNFEVSVSGGESKVLQISRSAASVYTVAYAAENNSIKITVDEQTIYLSLPDGFDCDYVMFDFVFRGNSQGNKVSISRVQNQAICRDKSDDFAPQIYGSTAAGRVEKGLKSVIGKAIVSDALSSVLKGDVLLTVTSPNGSVLTTDDGIALDGVLADRDYNVTYSEYGNYRILYSATDSSGKYAEQPYVVKVIDAVAPVVAFDDGSDENTVQKVRLGYKYQVKKYTATDNLDSPEKLTVITIIYDERNVVAFYNVSEFTMLDAGEYTVYVYAIDSDGNYGYRSYKVVAA